MTAPAIALLSQLTVPYTVTPSFRSRPAVWTDSNILPTRRYSLPLCMPTSYVSGKYPSKSSIVNDFEAIPTILHSCLAPLESVITIVSVSKGLFPKRIVKESFAPCSTTSTDSGTENITSKTSCLSSVLQPNETRMKYRTSRNEKYFLIAH